MPKAAKKKKYFKDDKRIKAVGAKIRKIRLSKKLTQEALANESGMDYSQVNRMELGKVNYGISYFFRIADALQIDPNELLS